MKKILLLLLICSTAYGQGTDVSLLRSINGGRLTSLDKPFQILSKSSIPISIALPVVLYGVSFFKKDSMLKHDAICIGSCILVATVVTTALKYTIDRDRPFVTYPDIVNISGGDVLGPSFPSGHTSDAFATATILALTYNKWYYTVPAYVWAGSVAYSRLDLGVHYPSDVLVGAIIGCGSAYLCYKFQHRKLIH